MTNKPANQPEVKQRPETVARSQDMQTAHQIHTLVQILYGQIRLAPPYVGPPAAFRGVEPMLGAPPVYYASRWPAGPATWTPGGFWQM